MMWRVSSQRIFKLLTTTPHIGDLKPLKMFMEVLSYGRSASLLYPALTFARQMGATKYIDTDNGILDPHTRTRIAFPLAATPDHRTFGGTSFFSGDWSSDRHGVQLLSHCEILLMTQLPACR